MRRGKQILALIMATAMTVSLTCAGAAAEYSDVGDHWAEGAISRWSGYGVVKGDENGRFHPNNNMTVAELATMLQNTMGYTVKADNTFADLKGDEWYADAVLYLAAAGILKGDGVNINATAPIDRERATVILARSMNIQPVSGGDLNGFTDGATAADWSAGYIKAMADAGIVQGVGDSVLALGANINRASVMTIMDKSVSDFITEGGTHEVTGKGITIVKTNADVTLTGSTKDVIVAPGSAKSSVTLDKLTVSGTVTVNADNAKLVAKSTTLADVTISAPGASVDLQGTSTGKNMVLTEAATGATLTVGKDAKVDTATVAAADAKASIAGTATSISATATATGSALTVEKGARVERVKTDAPQAEVAINAPVKSVEAGSNATGATVAVAQGVTVDTVKTDSAITLDNKGTVKNAEVNADGVKIAGNKPTQTVVPDSVTQKPTDATGKEIPSVKPEEAKPVDKLPAPPTPPTGGMGGGTGGDTGGGTTPTDSDMAWVRPDGNAADGSYKYAEEYGKLGVTVAKGTTENKNTVTILVDALKLIDKPIGTKLQSDSTFYVGIQFATPADAAYATITIGEDAASAPINLKQDGDNALDGKLVEYFSVADVAQGIASAVRDSKDYTVVANWYTDAEGKVAAATATTTYTVKRVISGGVVSTEAALTAALADTRIPTITVLGTIGAETSDDAYVSVDIKRPATIKGGRLYGTFNLLAEGVTLDGVAIHNRGGGDDAMKNAINIVAANATVQNCAIELSSGKGDIVSNAISIYPTSVAPNYTIKDNTIKGYEKTGGGFGSSGITVAEGFDYSKRFGLASGASVVTTSMNDREIALGNTYTNCKNEYVRVDWTDIAGKPNGDYRFGYYYDGYSSQFEESTKTATMLLAGTTEMGSNKSYPEHVTIELLDGANVTIAEGFTVTIAGTLKVSEGASLTVNGTLTYNGTLTNEGTIVVNDGTGLAMAAAVGGTIQMGKDVEVTAEALNTAWAQENRALAVVIDLNNNTLTVAGEKSVSLGYEATTQDTATDQKGLALDVTFKDGTINATNASGAFANFCIEQGQKLTLDGVNGVTVNTTGSALLVRGEEATLNIVNSEIESTGVYAISTNANSEANYGVAISVTGSTLTTKASDGDASPLMINVPGTLMVADSTINGQRQGLIVRAGTVDIQNSSINAVLETVGTGTNYYSSKWGGGNELPYGAVVVGKSDSGSGDVYKGNISLTFTNTTLSCTSTEVDSKYCSALYADNISAAATIVITGDCTVSAGNVVNKGAEKVDVTGASFKNESDEAVNVLAEIPESVVEPE